jgi:membrane-bound metal-dependent hydrolase YbcI (DUF457 family)
MFLAHLPTGYLVGASLARRWPQAITPAAWAAVLFGSVAPDLDLIYFYFLSDHSVNHHIYPPHVPIVWLAASCLVGLCLGCGPQRWRVVWAMFCTGWLLHLVLDTVAGGIWWLWPWVTTPYVLMEVPRRFDNSWLNFISHPSILLEVIIIVVSGQQWRKRSKPVSLRVNYAMRQPQRPYRTFL